MKTLEMIVPCFNEEETIAAFYKSISNVFQGISHKFDCSVIFVDDGSKDKTLGIIKSLADENNNVKYISFSRNFGKEGAMLAGLSYSSADLVGIIDADLQHDPKLIPPMLDAIENEEFCVAAAKRTDRIGENKFKSTLSNMFYAVSNRLSEVMIEPGAQDFRIMTRSVVDAVLSLSESERFSKGIFSFVGFPTKWFEHENAPRIAGASKWNIKQLFSYAISGITSFSSALLKLPLILSLLTLIAGIVLVIVAAISKSEFLGIVSAVILVGSVILFALGIMSVYISKLFKEAKNRPQFIVQSTNISQK